MVLIDQDFLNVLLKTDFWGHPLGSKFGSPGKKEALQLSKKKKHLRSALCASAERRQKNSLCLSGSAIWKKGAADLFLTTNPEYRYKREKVDMVPNWPKCDTSKSLGPSIESLINPKKETIRYGPNWPRFLKLVAKNRFHRPGET